MFRSASDSQSGSSSSSSSSSSSAASRAGDAEQDNEEKEADEGEDESADENDENEDDEDDEQDKGANTEQHPSSEAETKDAEEDPLLVSERDWASEQQKAFEAALKKYPSSLVGPSMTKRYARCLHLLVYSHPAVYRRLSTATSEMSRFNSDLCTVVNIAVF